MVMQEILGGDIRFDGDRWAGVSPEAVDFVNRLLDRDYNTRLTAEQALQHPWIADLFCEADTEHSGARCSFWFVKICAFVNSCRVGVASLCTQSGSRRNCHDCVCRGGRCEPRPRPSVWALHLRAKHTDIVKCIRCRVSAWVGRRAGRLQRRVSPGSSRGGRQPAQPRPCRRKGRGPVLRHRLGRRSLAAPVRGSAPGFHTPDVVRGCSPRSCAILPRDVAGRGSQQQSGSPPRPLLDNDGVTSAVDCVILLADRLA